MRQKPSNTTIPDEDSPGRPSQVERESLSSKLPRSSPNGHAQNGQATKAVQLGDTVEAELAAEIEKVEAFINGDLAAFKYIYAKYRQRIFSYCLYIIGDKTLAEDAFQEAFARAFTRRDQLKEPRALKSWLLLITRSVCLNMLRTSKFTPDFVYLDDVDPQEGEGFVPKELTSNPLDVGTGDVLRSALQRLAPMYREAFLLREFEGYSYEEISEMTGASVMNVKVRITRAKKMLRRFLEPHYPSSSAAPRPGRNSNKEKDDARDPNDSYETSSIAAQWA